ncbi:sterol-4-alpha-carboxylate 3-dehydrogenase [Protomyces lactucae-debilis]|uniref:Sterol-4-alpha-carboxylate 3-dehydrogenase n=1 Tax=Protomyces lactucae-debilis TaxID=2754530 RepID=A0A1Y2FSC4_PROLT|nr:sterol-4-alpha-carboxylate 3-dehydrogenase [Protomyces lactucae-debilis]ORY86901.1 sterol-4-alpha-carboxylate 3-dehydrogenase [Protomyces lactucae-debilis]
MVQDKQHVLIIGGNGFLGSHIITSFLDAGWPGSKLTVLDIREPNTKVPSVGYITGDICNPDDMRSAFRGIDIIVHTASPLHGLGRTVYFKVNVEGTRTIIDVAKELGVKGLVYTSSAGVVFDGSDLVNCNEDARIPEIAMDAYNESKAVAEQLVLDSNGPTFKTCALRPAGLFGEGDRQMIPGMLKILKNGQTRFQLGNNDNLFDYTYIGNAAHAHVLAAQKLLQKSQDPQHVYRSAEGIATNGVEGEAFFITNGTPIYFWDMPRAIFAYMGHKHTGSYIVLPKALATYMGLASEWVCWVLRKEPTFTRFRVQFACAQRYYDISKARERLGYEAPVSLQEGLARSLEWAKQNGEA